MRPIKRREFLRRSAALAAAAGLSVRPARKVLGANNRIVLGLMGAGGRGGYLGPEFAKRGDVELRYVADPDSRRAEGCAKKVEQAAGSRPQWFQDFRRMLDDPEVDGIVAATPDHWHALGTILACQAGKDVFVEKPTSHSIWESRKMVEAARKHDRVVQVGAQNRSADYCYAAFEYVRSADFGDIHFVRVINSKGRNSIGHKPDSEAPSWVDYDMWLGPAPMRPFNENRFHYAWHWMWDYSGGDIINDAIHQIDIARWLIDKPYPKSVTSEGGNFAFDDDQECPTTQTASWNYEDMTMVFEQTLWTPYMKKTPFELRDKDDLPNWPFSGTRIEVYGSRQLLFLSRHGGGWQAFDADCKSVAITPGRFSPSNAKHQDNFLECIRTRQRPNADIEALHLSTLLSHYGNTAYRTGRRLYIDPDTEGFVDDRKANALVKRKYRHPWVVPEKV